MPTEAARLTDVADAFDVYKVGDDERIDAFDAYFDLDFSFKQSSGLISREAGARGQTSECRPGNPEGCLPVDELSFTESTSLLNVRGEFGIFRDLAMTLNVPIILSKRLSFDYADGITPQSSSIDNVNASAGSTTSLFAHDLTATYKGVAPLELGLRLLVSTMSEPPLALHGFSHLSGHCPGLQQSTSRKWARPKTFR